MEGPPRITQKALANACGIKSPSVSDWLSGRTKHIEGANLLAASKFLKVRPEWLATGRGDMLQITLVSLEDNVDSDIQEVINAYKNLSPEDKIKFKSSIKNYEIENSSAKAQGRED